MAITISNIDINYEDKEEWKYQVRIINYILTLAIVPVITTTIVYASEAYPNWDEDREECIANGGYWKHAFCVYD